MRRIFTKVPTPSFVIDEGKLKDNLEILKSIEEETGAHILLAQKCFSMYSLYPLLGKYLSGTAASGIYEARLGHEAMGKENHVFSPAYQEKDIQELVKISDHIIFNSFSQWEKFKTIALRQKVSCGIRVNPECSTQQHAIYDPCAPGSRLGVKEADFRFDALDGLEGIHFHTLCEQGADALEVTLAAIEKKFGRAIKKMKWVNFGGGHHITRADYDRELLKKCILHIKER